MRRFLSIIAAASRKFSIPLYLDKYIIMDYDGTKQKDRQLFLTESIACAAIPERSGRVFFMSHNLLSINAQVSIKINRDTAIFLNKCLENRKIRINTHTHTHTHTHLSSLYAYIYANQESGLYTDTVRYLAYSMRKEVGCGCFSLLSGRGEQPFGVSNGVLSYSIDVL